MTIVGSMEKTKKTGRPPLPKAERRTALIKVLVTKAEKRRLEDMAEKDHRTVSDWMRAMALKAAE